MKGPVDRTRVFWKMSYFHSIIIIQLCRTIIYINMSKSLGSNNFKTVGTDQRYEEDTGTQRKKRKKKTTR